MKLSRFVVLSDEEIARIHESSLHILENCGVKIGSTKMIGFLESKGCCADHDKGIVRFNRSCIEDALSKVPRSFEVFRQDGEFAFTLGDGMPRIAAGHNAVFWADSESGSTRLSRVSDVELFARICENLPNIDMVGIPVMPQDVPDPKASLLYGVRACIENSRKPIYFSTDQGDVNNACIKLLRAAFAGDLQSQVYGITQLSPPVHCIGKKV